MVVFLASFFRAMQPQFQCVEGYETMSRCFEKMKVVNARTFKEKNSPDIR